MLINNAGLALGLEKEYEGSMDDRNTMADANIKGLLAITRLVVPGMVERGAGHVINIGGLPFAVLIPLRVPERRHRHKKALHPGF